jgi:uncharacterized Tic20 family protein
VTEQPSEQPPEQPSYPPPPPPGTGPAAGPPPGDDVLWAVLAHLSYFVLSLIGPLLIYLLVGDQRPFAKRQAAEALNFHITVLIASVVSGLLILVLVGIVLLPLVLIAGAVLSIIATVKASHHEDYRYPLTWRPIH